MMPIFRTAPSGNLTAAIRRLVASGGGKVTPLQEIQADAMAAQTAQHLGLAEKARAEAEAMRSAQADRSNPAVVTEYARNVAGLDAPTATRLSNHLRGVLEQPSAADIDDASMVGAEARPFVTGAPNLEPGQRRLFQSALASTIANRLATGKTNAHQLALSGEHINKTALMSEAANAEDVPTGNRIVSAIAGKLREPFKTNAQGTVLNEETGDLDESSQLAQAVRTGGARAVGAAPGERAPMGYRFAADGALEPIPGGPADPNRERPKVEKALPTSAAQKLFENQQNLRRAEQAFALIQGQQVGEVEGDTAATGVKGVLPDAVLQRVDPGGVATRAAIADLGSLIVHDRSGAAVTAAEFPRLKPFIPNVTDDAPTVKKKLQRFVQEYRNVTQEMVDFYTESGYRVPSDALRGSGAQGPSDLEKRFAADPAVKGMKLGGVRNGKREVLDGGGKLVGYYE